MLELTLRRLIRKLRLNKKNLILLIITLFILLVLAEILTRIFYPLVEQGYGYPVDMFIPDEKLAFKLNPGFEGYFKGGSYRKIPIKINSEGLRDYELDNFEKVILGVGDSITFGPGLRLNETYLALLENKLKEYRIIKAGVPSYEFVQYLEYIKERGVKYKPELIIVGFVLNDINQLNIEEVQEYMFKERRLRSGLKNLCQFCGFVWKDTRFIYYKVKEQNRLKTRSYYEVYLEALNKKWQGEEWEATKKNILELDKISREYNFKLLFIIFPFRDQIKYGETKLLPQRLFSKFMQENKLDYIDLYEYLDGNYYLLNDDVHLNLNGNEVVSNILYEYIKERLDF